MMKLYVGNLPFSADDSDLKELFEQYGDVTDVHMPEDRETGRPRGFGFVTMGSKEAMVDAIKGLDGQDFGGRPLKVKEAEDRRSGGGGGGGNFRGGGGGGNSRGGGGGYNQRGGGGGYRR